jgi:hypothetical protein
LGEKLPVAEAGYDLTGQEVVSAFGGDATARRSNTKNANNGLECRPIDICS